MPITREQPKTLKYWTLVQYLREQVSGEVLRPGDRAPSLAEMQERFGISRGTVEKAYSLLEQEGILVRSQGSGTFVMTPPSKPRYIIALSPQLVPNHHDLYGFNLLKGINACAKERRIEVIYSSHDYGSVWERADGMIISGGSLRDHGDAPASFPFVSLISETQGALGVVADDHSGMCQLTQHLLRLGHRKISLLYAYKPGSPLTTARYEGHKAALAGAELEFDGRFMRVQEPVVQEVEYQRDALQMAHVTAGYEGMKLWLADGWREFGCTAVMAYNDAMAVGIMRALTEVGIDVPGEVSVTGFDGTPAFDYLSPKLTTAYVPLYDIGYIGLKTLIDQLQNEPAVPSLTQLPVSIIPGDSTGAILKAP